MPLSSEQPLWQLIPCGWPAWRHRRSVVCILHTLTASRELHCMPKRFQCKQRVFQASGCQRWRQGPELDVHAAMLACFHMQNIGSTHGSSGNVRAIFDNASFVLAGPCSPPRSGRTGSCCRVPDRQVRHLLRHIGGDAANCWPINKAPTFAGSQARFTLAGEVPPALPCAVRHCLPLSATCLQRGRNTAASIRR